MGRFRYSVPAAVAFALLIVSVGVTATFAQSSGSGASVSVTGTDGMGVIFRSAPGGAAIGSFSDGTKLLVVGDNQQAAGRAWRNVRSPEGAVGWVATDYLSGTANAPGSTTTQASLRPGGAAGTSLQIIKTGGLNAILRDAPGGTQIGSYAEGSAMSLVSADAREAGGRQWRNVRGPDGKTGWMAALLLGEGGTPATNTNLVSSRSPFTLTADMRARALAARARAVPLTSTGNQSNPTDKPSDPTKPTSPSNKPPSSSSSSSSSSPSNKKP
jgi:hypothetical protein